MHADFLPSLNPRPRAADDAADVTDRELTECHSHCDVRRLPRLASRKPHLAVYL